MQTKDLLDAASSMIPAFFVVCGIFGFGGNKDSSDQEEARLDRSTIERRLSLGLDDLSDADRRSGGFSSVDPESLTIEQAQMAADILRKLGHKR